MKEKNKEENILLIVLFFMSFSIGIWSNYRQLWLESNGFNIVNISRLFSISLICSAIISLIISFASSKIKIKNLIFESILLRIISMIILLFLKNIFIVKTCILVCIMCEVIFLIAYYPLLSFTNNSEETFRKKTFIDYLSRDLGIIICGLLIGTTLENNIFNYNSCLFLSLVSCIISGIFLLLYNNNNYSIKRKNVAFSNSMKKIFHSKVNNWFLFSQLLVNISYGIIFDLMMLILTGFIKFDISYASIFIIICNAFGSIACSYYNKKGKKYSVKKSAWIKFGSRAITYLIAFLTNNMVIFVISIIIAFITSRILEDKVLGIFLKKIDNENKFLFENIRYFIACIGEGIGVFISGILINISFRILFLGAGFFTLLQVLFLSYCEKIDK